MVVWQNLKFPYKLSLTWFERKIKMGFEFEFNLNQVHLLLIPSNYKMKYCRLHSKCYNEN
jgi:hypothetical protein